MVVCGCGGGDVCCSDKIANATGMVFHSFDDTLRETVKSLVTIGGVAPKK